MSKKIILGVALILLLLVSGCGMTDKYYVRLTNAINYNGIIIQIGVTANDSLRSYKDELKEFYTVYRVVRLDSDIPVAKFTNVREAQAFCDSLNAKAR